MTPVKQTITGTPYANCMQAAVASYLDLPLDRVPNFMLFHNQWWEACYNFFLGLGYDFGYVDGEPPKDGKYYITSVEFEDNDEFVHAVIWKDGIIIHDPHKTGEDQTDVIKGYYWISKRDK